LEIIRAVLDVFDAFLSIESTHVFANAALDCIGCLLRHVRGSEERRQLEEIVEIEVDCKRCECNKIIIILIECLIHNLE